MRWPWCWLAVVGWLLGCQPPLEPALRIGAAADMQYAFDSLLVVYRAQQQPVKKISPVYGSSGKLYEQIGQGMPLDLFFSADIHYPTLLHARGLTATAPEPYGVGRLVLWSLRTDPAARAMETLRDPSLSKIAVANPEHAPYGARARECLAHYDLTAAVQNRLVYGENIAQAAQFVTTGSADIGLLALSLALAPPLQAAGGQYWLVPDSSHTPLVQAFVVTQRAAQDPEAQAFAAFVRSDTARAVLAHFGFEAPAE